MFLSSKQGGKVKQELRVISSNPRVTRLKGRIARLKARGGRLKAQVRKLKALVRRLKARCSPECLLFYPTLPFIFS